MQNIKEIFERANLDNMISYLLDEPGPTKHGSEIKNNKNLVREIPTRFLSSGREI